LVWIAVALDLAAGQIGDDLLVGGTEVVVATLAVLQPEQRVRKQIPAAGLPEVVGGQQRRQQHLLRPGAVHLFANDVLDPLQHPHAQRQEAVDARSHAPDVAGPGEQDVARARRIGRSFLQGGEKSAPVSHDDRGPT
jgi:hypothetical protein